MRHPGITRQILFTLLSVFSLTAFASTSGITYQGRIVKPDGAPLAGQFTQFKMQLRTPDSGSCLMYEEVQSQDLRNSGGTFSLTMNDGSGSRTDATGLTLDRIFGNYGSFSLAPATCNTGTGTYAPGPGDGRNLVVLFKDETMGTWEPIPAQKINFVPLAFESKQVQGFTADSLLRVVNGSGDPITGLAPLSNAQYTELLALVNGTSTAFTKNGQLGGVALPTMNPGEALGWNGTAWVSTPAGTPAANSITTTMLQGGSVTGAKLDPAISIATSGTIASAVTTTRDFKIYATSPSTFYVEMLAPALASSYTLTWPLNTGAAGQVLTTNGSGVLSWTTPSSAGITALTGDVTATGPGAAAATVASVGGVTAANVASGANAANAATALSTASKIVSRDASGNFAAGVATVNGLTLSNGASLLNIVNPIGGAWTMTLPQTAGSNGQVMQTNGSGVMTWATPFSSATGFVNGGNAFGANASLGTNDNFRLDIKTNSATAMTVLPSGNVGVGTTAPGYTLDVSGKVRSQSDFILGTAGSKMFESGGNIVLVPQNGTITTNFGANVQILDGSGTPNVRLDGLAGNTSYIASGKLGIGTTSPSSQLSVVSQVSVGPSTAADGITSDNYSNSQTGAYFSTRYSRGTLAAPLAVTNGNYIGNYTFSGFDGTAFANPYNSASVTAHSTENWSATAHGTAIEFFTVPNGSAVGSASPSMQVDQNGNVGIGLTSAPTKLAVAGTVLLGNGGETCAAPIAGAIRYNGGNLQFCNGSAWSTLGVAGAGITALTGDVTASGAGSVAATVASVGGVTAANVASGAALANAATNTNTVNAIVKRDGTGSFSAKNISADSLQLRDSGANIVTLKAPTTVSPSYTLYWPSAVAASAGQVLTSDTSGNLSWTTPSTAPTGAAGGDLAGTYPNPSVATVGAVTAANVASGANAANAATALNTSSKIVSRDASGNFAANVATVNGLTLSNGASLLNIVNPIGGAWTMTLPQTAGSNGQVMQTNGSGIMTWATPLTSATGFVNGGNSFGAASNLGNIDNFDLNIKTNNLNRVVVTAGGNVGIGTTAPLSKFQVSGIPGTTENAMFNFTGTGQVSLGMNLAWNGANWIAKSDGMTNGGSMVLGNNLGELGFYTVPASGFVDQSISSAAMASNRRLTITSAGNVGIGTTSPGSALDVKGAIRLSGATSGYSGFQVPATAGSTVYTLPATAPAAGQVLSSTAGGVLSWVNDSTGTPAGANTQIQFNNSGAFGASSSLTWNGTNLLVGSGTGIQTLIGPAAVTARTASGATLQASFYSMSNATAGANMGTLQLSDAMYSAGAEVSGVATEAHSAGVVGTALTMSTVPNGSATKAERVRVDQNGNVGIGTTAPGALLDVKGAIRMSGSTSGYTGFQPAAAAGSTVWTLPAADGTSGQLLSTNGAGILSWSTAGSGSQWTTQAPGINYMAGNVGIGTTSAATALEVVANAGDYRPATFSGNAGFDDSVIQINSNSGSGRPGIQFNQPANGGWSTYLNPGNDYVIMPGTNLNSPSANAIYFKNTGFVGIGTSSPKGRLDIKGGTSIGSYAGVTAPPANGMIISGNVGIGTTAPNGKLDVKGAIVMSGATSGYSGFQPAAAAGSTIWTLPSADGTSGQVLSTSGSGLLSWTTPSGGGITTLTGDVTATGTGSVAATVANVGGVTAANVASGANAANAATALNTASKIVSRDGSGNFAANVATFNGVSLNNGGALLNIASPVGGAWTMTLPQTAGSSGQVMQTNGSGLLTWITPVTSATGFVNGGNSFGAISNLGNNDNFDLNIKTNNLSRMTVTAGGNVGIGTTSPSGIFEVNGGAVGSGNGSDVIVTPQASGSGFGDTGGALRLRAGTSNGINSKGGSVYISAGDSTNGNYAGNIILNTAPGLANQGVVGINVANPSYMLDVGATYDGPGPAPVARFARTNAPYTGITSTVMFGANRTTGGMTNLAEVGTVMSDIGNATYKGELTFGTANGAAPSERMRIDHAGFVGIGTTAPAAKLDTETASTSASASEETNMLSKITAQPSGAGAGIRTGFYSEASIPGAATQNTGDLRANFAYANHSGSGTVTSVMANRLWASNTGSGTATEVDGQFVGAQSGSGTTPTLNGISVLAFTGGGTVTTMKGLHIVTDSYGGTITDRYGIFLKAPQTFGTVSGKDYGIFQEGTQSNSFGGKVGIGTTSPSEMLEVNGNVKATSFISTSDIRLKESVQKMDGLSIIDRLTGVSWLWKKDKKQDAGVIAQEVEKVLPFAVVTDPTTGLKAVKYNALIAPLIESTKELHQMCLVNDETNHRQDRDIASLKKENSELKAELETLKARMDKIEAALSKAH